MEGRMKLTTRLRRSAAPLALGFGLIFASVAIAQEKHPESESTYEPSLESLPTDWSQPGTHEGVPTMTADEFNQGRKIFF